MKMTPEDLNNPEVMFPSAKKELDIGNRTAIDVLQDPPALRKSGPSLTDDSGFPLSEMQVDPLFVAAVDKEEKDIQRHREYLLLCERGGVDPMDYWDWLEFDKRYQEHVRTAGSVLSPATFQRLSETKADCAEVEHLKQKVEQLVQDKLQLHKDLNTLYSERDSLKVQVMELSDRFSSLDEHNSYLCTENNELKNSLESKITARTAPLVSRIELLEEHVRAVDEENGRLVKIITDSNEEIVTLHAQINRPTPANYALYPHYFRETPNTTHVDVNWFLEAWGVGHTVGHAVKKLMCLGQRGVKGKLQDLEEARNSINRAIELEQTK